MNKNLFTTVTLSLASLLFVACGEKESEQAEQETEAVEYPMPVCARYSTSWYEAEVLSEKDGNYHVKYHDGIEADLSKEDVKDLLTKEQIKVNDRVLAVWRSGAFYEGSVTEVKSNGAIVKWDDGSTPSLVAFSKIAKGFPKSNKPKFSDLGGEEVCVETNGSFVLAKLQSSKDGISHVITYSDTELDLPSAAVIKPLKNAASLKVGDKVMAIWSSSIYYPGTITTIDENGIIVKWEDGSKPSFVENGKFYKK